MEFQISYGSHLTSNLLFCFKNTLQQPIMVIIAMFRYFLRIKSPDKCLICTTDKQHVRWMIFPQSFVLNETRTNETKQSAELRVSKAATVPLAPTTSNLYTDFNTFTHNTTIYITYQFRYNLRTMCIIGAFHIVNNSSICMTGQFYLP